MHREIMQLAALILIAAASFSFTRLAAGSNRRMHTRDAATSYEAGQRALRAGNAPLAVTTLRRATSTERENRQYQLALATALAAAGEFSAERQVLVSLRNETPEDPEVNVRLARAEVRNGNLLPAVRYYQNALYGFWPDGQMNARRALRAELIAYLLGAGQQGRALSELLLLAADLPNTAASHNQLGGLFLRAGDARRSLAQFRSALRLAPSDTVAFAGAGAASFELGQYAQALAYLRNSAHLSPELREQSAIAQLILANDPLARHLSAQERARRVSTDLSRATQRLSGCMAMQNAFGRPAGELDNLQADINAITPRAAARAIQHSPELTEAAVDLIFRVETATSQSCPGATPFDRALLLIGKQYGSQSQ